MPLHFLIIGSGLSGSVLARELADNIDCTIDIWKEKTTSPVIVLLQRMKRRTSWFIIMAHIFSLQIKKRFGIISAEFRH